jgi:DNA-binding transcriptional regulator YdaS (Cro superfamily)
MKAIDKAIEVIGGKSSLARAIGVTPQMVSQWARVEKPKPIPVTRCIAIEQATGGAVTRKDLRPNDWHLIWPEFASDNDSVAASDDTQPPVGTSSRKRKKK